MANRASELAHRIEKLETLAKVLKDELKAIQDECKHVNARPIHPGTDFGDEPMIEHVEEE